MSNEIFNHECVARWCQQIIEFDDEPWCFTHSPDEGSSLKGYSARAEAARFVNENCEAI